MGKNKKNYQSQVPEIIELAAGIRNINSRDKGTEVYYESCSTDSKSIIAATNTIMRDALEITGYEKSLLEEDGSYISFSKRDTDENGNELCISSVCSMEMLPPGDFVKFHRFKMVAPYDGCHYCNGWIFYAGSRDIEIGEWKVVELYIPGRYSDLLDRYIKIKKDLHIDSLKYDDILGFFYYMDKTETLEEARFLSESELFIGIPEEMASDLCKISQDHCTYKFHWRCSDCDRWISDAPTMYAGSRGLGGCAVQAEDPVCDDCMSLNSCDECDRYEKGYRDTGKCSSCGQRCICCKELEGDFSDIFIGQLIEESIIKKDDSNYKDLIIDLEEARFKGVLTTCSNPCDFILGDPIESMEEDELEMCPDCRMATKLLKERKMI